MNTSIIFQKKKFWTRTKVFFIAYAALLAISVPNQAYFFSAYGPQTLLDQIIAISVAVFIEANIWVTTFAIYSIWVDAKKNGWEKFFQILPLLVWVLICTSISFIANLTHAFHYENPILLTGTQIIPMHQYLPLFVSLWPFMGIVFSVVSKTITTYTEKLPEPDDPFKGMTQQEIKEFGEIEAAKIVTIGMIQNAQASVQGALLGERVRSNVGGVWGAILSVFARVEQGKTTVNENDDLIDQYTQKGEQITISRSQPKPHPRIAQRASATNDGGSALILPSPSKDDPVRQASVALQGVSLDFFQSVEFTSPTPPFTPTHFEDDGKNIPDEDLPASTNPAPFFPALRMGKPKDIDAKECDYRKSDGICVINHVRFVRLSNAYAGELSEEQLNFLMAHEGVPLKYFRYVKSGMIRTKVVVENPNILLLFQQQLQEWRDKGVKI